MSDNEKSIESSGNVFEDLGFDKAEARTLLVRARMMLALTRQLRAMERTQTELAGMLGIGQSRVSDLMKGKAKLFSLDMLLSLAQRLGMQVTVEVQPQTATARPPHRSRPEAPAFRRVVMATATVQRVRGTSWGTATGILVQGPREDSVGVAPAHVHDSATVVGVGKYRYAQLPSTTFTNSARRAA